MSDFSGLEELGILDNRYLIEQSVSFDKDDFSCWISPEFKISPLRGSTHISFLLTHLDWFGFTEDHVNELEDKYSKMEEDSPVVKNKVSDHLFLEAFSKGWIRVRHQVKCNNFSVEFQNVKVAEHNICLWAEMMMQVGYGSCTALIKCWGSNQLFEFPIKYIDTYSVQVFNS